MGVLWSVRSSCSTGDTRRVNLVTNPVNSHEWGKDREVLTTSGIYPSSFVTQIFHSGQPSYKTFEVITLGSVASLLTGNPDILRDIYTQYAGAAGMLLHIIGVHNGKIEIISFVVKFRSWPPPLSILTCRSRYEAGLYVSAVFFNPSSTGQMRSTK